MMGLSLQSRLVAATSLLMLLPAAVVAGLWAMARFPALAPVLAVVPVAGTAVLAALTRPVLRNLRPEPLPGPELTASGAPALWAGLTGLCSRMGLPLPDRVVVCHTATATAVVTANPITSATSGDRRGTAAGGARRELRIGLPLLAGLTRAELDAVLAHALGHLAVGRTGAGAVLMKAQEVLERTEEELHPGPLRAIVQRQLRVHRRLAALAWRERERECDLWAARIAGSEATDSALHRTALLDAAWSLVEQVHLPMFAGAGRRAGLCNALAELMHSRADELHRMAHERPAPGDDTRAPLAQRRAAATALRLPAPTGTGGGTGTGTGTGTGDAICPAWQLLGGEERLVDLEGELLSEEFPVSDWAEVMRVTVLADAERVSAQLAGQLLRQGRGADPTLRQLLTMIADGRGEALVTPLMRGDVPRATWRTAARDQLAEALDAVLVTVFDQAGRIRVVPEWGAAGPWRLVLLDENGSRDWPFGPLVSAAVDRFSDVRLLTEALEREKLDLDAELAADTGPPPSIALAAITHTRARPRLGHRADRHDLLVYDDGLLTVTTPGEHLLSSWRALVRTLSHSALRRGAVHRIQDAITEIGADPENWATDPRNAAVWLPFGAVRSARWRPRGLQLTMHDGSRRRFRLTDVSVVIGTPREVIQDAVS